MFEILFGIVFACSSFLLGLLIFNSFRGLEVNKFFLHAALSIKLLLIAIVLLLAGKIEVTALIFLRFFAGFIGTILCLYGFIWKRLRKQSDGTKTCNH